MPCNSMKFIAPTRRRKINTKRWNYNIIKLLWVPFLIHYVHCLLQGLILGLYQDEKDVILTTASKGFNATKADLSNLINVYVCSVSNWVGFMLHIGKRCSKAFLATLLRILDLSFKKVDHFNIFDLSCKISQFYL